MLPKRASAPSRFRSKEVSFAFRGRAAEAAVGGRGADGEDDRHGAGERLADQRVPAAGLLRRQERHDFLHRRLAVLVEVLLASFLEVFLGSAEGAWRMAGAEARAVEGGRLDGADLLTLVGSQLQFGDDFRI